MRQKFILGLLVATLAVSTQGQEYFVASPNVFRPGSSYQASIGYIGASQANIEVSLGQDEQQPLASTTLSLLNGAAVATLQIPMVVPVGTYKLKVVGTAGNVQIFSNSTQVTLTSKKNLLLVQTDKPIYKPSQTVKIRVLCVDLQMKPVTDNTTVSVFDENNNKLEQFINVECKQGVIERDFELSDQPPLGEYRISVQNEFAENEKKFKVDKYVLPKFEVKVELSPNYIVQGQNSPITVKGTCKYTYGKPVRGKATFFFGIGKVFSKTISLPGTGDGSFEETFDGRDIESYSNGQSLQLVVNVTDDATKIIESSGVVNIKAHPSPITITFLPSSAKTFRPGLPVKLMLRVWDLVNDQPGHVGKSVEISFWAQENIKKPAVIGTDGMVSTNIVVPKSSTSETISVTAKVNNDIRAYQTLYKYQTKLGTTLAVEVTAPTQQPIIAGEDFDIDITASTSLRLLAYIVLSRGSIVDSGPLQMSGTTMTHTITTTRDMSPAANVVVYGVASDGEVFEVIADSVPISVKGVFDNQVTMAFSKSEGKSGSNVDVTITSSPNSKYFTLVVDKSVLLLGTGNDVTQAEVLNGVRDFNLEKTITLQGKVDGHGGGDAMPFLPGGINPKDVESSAGQQFKKRGLLYMSGMTILETTPRLQREFFNVAFAGGCPECDMIEESSVDSPPETSGGEPEVAEVGRQRVFFPESWLFTNGMTDGQGKHTFAEKIPDTITEWIGTTFVMSPSKGLAVTSEPAKLRSFQNFFVSLTLPYSLTRGESFTLLATVFNYKADAQVVVSIVQSEKFDVTGNLRQTIMVKKNIPKSVEFKVSPKVLGKIRLNVTAEPEVSLGEPGDGLSREILVKAEGVVHTKPVTRTIQFNETMTEIKESIALDFPDNVVKGSRRIEVQVTGDVMGPTLDGLERLLKVPYGCGEQNMITLVPNIAVTDYLKQVERLSNEIEDKAVRNMKMGVQRELQYKRTSGSFSAFGNSDAAGSTWLTAFVVKSFAQADSYVTIDDKVMNSAIDWLLTGLSNGKVRNRGKVIHQEMIGGGNSEGALTAFVYIALKEADRFLSVIQKNKMSTIEDYLVGLAQSPSSDYQKAILAYALALADNPMANTLLDQLNNAEKPWERPPITVNKPELLEDGVAKRWIPRPPQASASDIETWSYVLLARVALDQVAAGQPIMKWLIEQQNGNGGFVSTQDTMLGLQALGRYAGLVYKNPGTDITLEVRSNSDSHTFEIEEAKILLLQRYKMKDDATFVELTARGTGLAIFKVVYQYNLLQGENKSTRDGSLAMTLKSSKYSDTLYNLEVCIGSSNPGNTGMVVCSVGLPTGMGLANAPSLSETDLSRIDVDNEGVHLYLNEAPKSSSKECYNLNLQKEGFEIENVKPAYAKTFSYYNPDIAVTEDYALNGVKISYCDICEASDCKKANCPEPNHGNSLFTQTSVLLTTVICILASIIMAI